MFKLPSLAVQAVCYILWSHFIGDASTNRHAYTQATTAICISLWSHLGTKGDGHFRQFRNSKKNCTQCNKSVWHLLHSDVTTDCRMLTVSITARKCLWRVSQNIFPGEKFTPTYVIWVWICISTCSYLRVSSLLCTEPGSFVKWCGSS